MKIFQQENFPIYSIPHMHAALSINQVLGKMNHTSFVTSKTPSCIF